MRVLVVDDDADLRRIMKLYLRQAGCEVSEASDGAAALAMLDDTHHPIVVTDVDMPVMNGIELARRIRARQPDTYTYVIVLTGLRDTDTLDRCMQAGVDDFLRKPFSLPEMIARLKVADRITSLQLQLAERNRELEASNNDLQRLNLRTTDALRAAARVQRSLLPPEHLTLPGLEFAWRVVPCEALAGDVLNLIRLDERHVGFYILDVSGHGVAAALLSAQLSRMMSPSLGHSQLLKEPQSGPPGYRLVTPVEVIERLDQQFPCDDRTSQFFTLIYGIINIPERTLALAGAGHPGPLLVPDRRPVADLTTPGSPIGLGIGGSWTENELTLAHGDRLVLFSDGLPDAADGADRPFSVERLLAVAESLRDRDAAGCCEGIMRAVDDWCEGKPQDDQSLLVIDLT